MAGWTFTKPLNIARAGHSATALANGKILVVSGYAYASVDGEQSPTVLNSAEIYDPRSEGWALTGSAYYARTGHTATLLRNGKVLVAGGTYDTNTELYDPGSGQFFATGRLNSTRIGHAAALLSDGRVLAAGGSDDNVNRFNPLRWTRTAEIYDPVTQVWTPTGALSTARYGATATVLLDGKVLVVGGSNSEFEDRTVEIFDPVSGTWTNTGSLFFPRWYHSAALLPGGKVLVTGGKGYLPPNSPPFTTVPPLSATELYDPGSGNWSTAGALQVARSSHRATALSDGKVLVTGGISQNPKSSRDFVVYAVESFDPATLVWTTVSDLNVSRYDHTATLFGERPTAPIVGMSSVLVAGGVPELTSSVVSGSAELQNETVPVTRL
jgi:N-acetylneuraminic acid mutarotase